MYRALAQPPLVSRTIIYYPPNKSFTGPSHCTSVSVRAEQVALNTSLSRKEAFLFIYIQHTHYTPPTGVICSLLWKSSCSFVIFYNNKKKNHFLMYLGLIQRTVKYWQFLPFWSCRYSALVRVRSLGQIPLGYTVGIQTTLDSSYTSVNPI